MKKTTKGNKFIKGLLIGTTGVAMLTSVLSMPLINIFQVANGYTSPATDINNQYTSTAFKITDIRVPTSVKYGDDIKITDGVLTNLNNGTTPTPGINIVPTITENTGKKINLDDVKTNSSWNGQGARPSANIVFNTAENVYQFKAGIKGNRAYKVFYEYVETRNGKKQTLARSEDYYVNVSSVAYSVKTETNVKYTSDNAQLGVFYPMPLVSGLQLQAEQTFTLQVPKITDSEGNILFYDKNNKFGSSYYTSATKYVSVKDFAGLITEEELLNGQTKSGKTTVDVPNVGVIDISKENFPYVGTTNVDDDGLSVSIRNSKGQALSAGRITNLDLKDKYGRSVKTMSVHLPDGSALGDYGNYTIQYTFSDKDGVENDLTRAYSFNVGIKESTGSTLSLSFDGLRPPTTATKGAEITLSSITAKDSLTGTALQNVYTKVTVTFVKNGREYNPDTYSGEATSTAMNQTLSDKEKMNFGKDVSDNLTFRLTNAMNEDGAYYIRYFTFSVTDSTLESKVYRYTISSVTDSVAPTVRLVEDYNQDNFTSEQDNASQYRVYNPNTTVTTAPSKENQAVVADATKLVDGTYLLPTKVASFTAATAQDLITQGDTYIADHADLNSTNPVDPQNMKKYVAKVYFPAVFASDDVSRLGGIRIERTITLQGTNPKPYDLSAEYFEQHKLNNQNVLAPNRGAYIYLENEGTYTMTITVMDEANNTRTIRDYEFVVAGTPGNVTATPTGLGLSVPQVFEIGETVKFEQPKAVHSVDSNLKVETFYFYEGNGYTPQQRTKLDALKNAIQTTKNYNAIREALADCNGLVFEPETKVNDNTYYYINPKSNNLLDKDIYVFSFSASYAVRNTPQTGGNVDCSTSFVKIQNKNKLYNADLTAPTIEDNTGISEKYNERFPEQSAWNERTGWFYTGADNGIDSKEPYKVAGGMIADTSDLALKNSFVNAYQNHLIRLPDISFTDGDSGFGITARAFRVSDTINNNGTPGSGVAAADDYYDATAFGGILGANVRTGEQSRTHSIKQAGTGYSAGNTISIEVNSVTYNATVAVGGSGEVTAITWASSLPANLTVGDYVATGGTGTGLEITISALTNKQIVGGTYTPSKEGDYIISYTARDNYGNSTVISFGFNVTDTEPPSITHGSLPTTLELGETYNFPMPKIIDNDVVMTNGICGVDYGIEMIGASNPSDSGFNTTTLVWTPTVEGVYSFRYFAKDSAGNEKKGAIFTIEVSDTVPPLIDVKVDELNNMIAQHSPDQDIIPLIFDENSLCSVPLDKITGTNSYKNIEIPTFVAGDAVSQVITILYNGVTAIDVLYSLDDYTQNVTSVNLSKVGSSTEMYADGTRLFFNPTSGHGVYTVKYQATDEKGNVATKEYKIAVGDTENPVITGYDSDFSSKDFAIGDKLTIDRTKFKAVDSGSETPNRFQYGYGGYKPPDNAAAEETAKDHTLYAGAVNIVIWYDGTSAELEAKYDGDKIYSEYTFTKAGSYRVVYRVMDLAGNSATREVSFTVKESHGTTENDGWPTWAKVLLSVGSLGVLGVVIWLVLKNPSKIKGKRKKDLIKTDDPVV